jgi:hypothetical protein
MESAGGNSAFERTHLLRNDLDWLPGWLKAIRWTVAGGVWTGLFGGVAALMFTSHVNFIFFGKGISALALGGLYAGDKAARSVLRRRLAKLAHGDVDLKKLKQEADGELVHVVGRVRAKQRIEGLLGGEGVYRRISFTIGEARVVHEKAVDFALVDESGEAIVVQAAGARLIVPDEKLHPIGSNRAEVLMSLPLPPSAARAASDWQVRVRSGKRMAQIRAAEVLLKDGDQVDVVGYKSRVVDPTVAERLERETPFRATVRSGNELPLLISPVRQ